MQKILWWIKYQSSKRRQDQDCWFLSFGLRRGSAVVHIGVTRTPSINTSHVFQASLIPFRGWEVLSQNNNDVMFGVKTNPPNPFIPFLLGRYRPQASVAAQASCNTCENTSRVTKSYSHWSVFLYFMLVSFHSLTPSFGHGGCWQIKWTAWVP